MHRKAKIDRKIDHIKIFSGANISSGITGTIINNNIVHKITISGQLVNNFFNIFRFVICRYDY